MRILHADLAHRDGYLAKALAEAGHVVEEAVDAASLLLAAGEPFDALVVEAAGVDQPPVERLAGTSAAVLMLVVDAAGAAERTRALRLGADACFARPVQFMELEARLAALVRLAHGAGRADSDMVLDIAARSARIGDRSLLLPPRDFSLLEFLRARGGEPASAEQILAHVWGEGENPERVRTAVARLRGRLAGAFGAPLIVSVRGHGYRLDAKMKLSSSG